MAEDVVRRGGVWDGLVVSVAGALVLVFLGYILIDGGLELIGLRGSWYYLIAGAGLVASGLIMPFHRGWSGVVFGVVLIATLIWSVWEAGLSFWPLLPRVFSPVVVGIGVLIVLFGARKGKALGLALTGGGVAIGLAILGVTLVMQFSTGEARAAAPVTAAADASAPGDWRHYGRDAAGTRYAPAAQITRANVGGLKEAWRIRTGDTPTGTFEDENTPMQIGDTVYVCTPRNRVIAVDADTGAVRWRYDPKLDGDRYHRCRGLGYFEVAGAAPDRPCGKRIIGATLTAEIFALDAATGALCQDFGTGGKVDLYEGQAEPARGGYFPTSAPTVAGGLIITGAWTPDNFAISEPAGVVRAFSATTGELVWVWNAADGAAGTPLNGPYKRGGPNVWSTPAVDEALGLIYLPTGNATPDFWASHRSDVADQYNSSVVALDLATGKERWKFQTVHHDVWDYDVGSQPMLVDLPNGAGASVPALIQLTKRGQIFVLDRRTGTPLARVAEKTVPQGPAPGEWLSPTQPYSVGMPTMGGEHLSERMMWGVTPIDQMKCRIAFRQKRYDGDFTPAGIKPNIEYPGTAGGQNWGSGAYDARRNYLIVNDVRLPMSITLTPTNKPDLALSRAVDRSAKGANAVSYDTNQDFFLSRLGVPCVAPPHATLTAIDLATRKIVWRVPVGTAENSGPWGRKSGLKIPLGVPGVAGSVATGGGLIFHSATTEPYLRAYDSGTGKKVWEARLPVGSDATPMSYVSPATGRQYVVVSAGGARNAPERGDYVVAYALPVPAANLRPRQP